MSSDLFRISLLLTSLIRNQGFAATRYRIVAQLIAPLTVMLRQNVVFMEHLAHKNALQSFAALNSGILASLNILLLKSSAVLLSRLC